MKRPGISKKKQLTISRALNVVLLLALFVSFAYDKRGMIKRAVEIGGVEYSYLDNSQWHAFTSMFDAYNLEKAEIVFVGDSITSNCCFHEFIPDRLIANRGIGSDTTEGLLNRLDSIISLEPEKIVIMIGINDVGRGISTEQVLSNMEDVLKNLTSGLPKTKIALMSVLPATTVDNKRVEEINAGYKKMTEHFECLYVDMYSECMNQSKIKTELFSSDGVHLNGEGYKLYMNSISDFLE